MAGQLGDSIFHVRAQESVNKLTAYSLGLFHEDLVGQ